MASPTPPDGFVSLHDAQNQLNQLYSAIGICVDHLTPTKTKGPDFTATFTLSDPSWFNGLGMKFRLFNTSIERLPSIQQNGDVLILRNVTTIKFGGQLLGTSRPSTTWILLSRSSILQSTCPNGSDISITGSGGPPNVKSQPTKDELRYVKEIFGLADPTSFKPPPVPTTLDVEHQIKEAGGVVPQRKSKWRSVQDLIIPSNGPYEFADLFGEVRKTWNEDWGRIKLSLTDYTSNKRLFNYSAEPQSRDGDEFGHTSLSHGNWPGPWGRMTIEVLLYDAHADFARTTVKVGTYVLIRNCQIKLDPNGSRLEGVCRGDREDPSKINVSVYNPHQARNDDRFEDLLKRRLEYQKLAKAQGLRFGFDRLEKQDSTKRSIDSVNDQGSESNAAAPGRQSKKTRRRERKKKNAANASETSKDVGPANVNTLNKNIRCNTFEVPPKQISDILDQTILERRGPDGRDFCLPFQNCCYKTRLRVVDYYPHSIADFCVPRLVTDYDSLSDVEDDEDFSLTLTTAQTNPHCVRWEWRFMLVVEDATSSSMASGIQPAQMVLLVADTDGDFLFREDACDLRANPQKLAALKENLFVLWGDLQEEKEKAMSQSKDQDVKIRSMPFECLVKEYGIPLPQSEKDVTRGPSFQRMFRIHGTSIMLTG